MRARDGRLERRFLARRTAPTGPATAASPPGLAHRRKLVRWRLRARFGAVSFQTILKTDGTHPTHRSLRPEESTPRNRETSWHRTADRAGFLISQSLCRTRKDHVRRYLTERLGQKCCEF